MLQPYAGLTVRLGAASVLIATLLVSQSAFAQFAPPEAPPAEVETVRLLVGYEPDTEGLQLVETIVADTVIGLGGTIHHRYHIVPAMAIEIPADAVDALQADDMFSVIEPDGEFSINAQETPYGIAKINADLTYQQGFGGAGIKVAVIDTGIDLDHPDLQANIYINEAEANGTPGVDDDGNGFVDDISGWNFHGGNNDADDDNGHGTHCAGTVGAIDNDIGVIGVAPDVTLIPIKVLGANGSGSFSSIIAAIEYCTDNGVHITSNSYGSGGNPGSIVEAAFNAADAAGILNISSAGNSGNSSGTGTNTGYPANFASVVAVASTTSSDNRSSFSSTGPNVEVAAPGSGVRSTVPNGGYARFSGTSMACPHVAGAAAVLMGSGITNNNEVRELLRSTAVDLGEAGVDNLFGYGRIDVLEALEAGGGDPPPEDPVVRARYLRYKDLRGGRDLRVRVKMEDENGVSVSGAVVSITIESTSGYSRTFVRTTNSKGIATVKIKDADSGTWTSTINSVEIDGYAWDGVTPANGFDR